jgi:hypothetical protein
VTPRWASSSDKHDISRGQQIYALLHPTYRVRLDSEKFDEGDVWLYIGHPHAQTERELEVLVNIYTDGREALVFHAMHLGSKFRRYRQENPHDDG